MLRDNSVALGMNNKFVKTPSRVLSNQINKNESFHLILFSFLFCEDVKWLTNLIKFLKSLFNYTHYHNNVRSRTLREEAQVL